MHCSAGKFSLPDELEFLIRNTGVTGRNFSGDDDGGLLVTVRSIAGTVQCALRSLARTCTPAAARCSLTPVRACAVVYPFMTPISDGGLQKSRLALIREQLKWRLVGCELVECYQ